MSVARVEQWLSSLGLRDYTQVFIDNGYDDFELCKNLKESDLDLMGITVPIVKAEILSSTNALTKLKTPDASHVYFTVEPNYWVPPVVPNDDPVVDFHPQTLPLSKTSAPIVSRKSDSTDLYNRVISELGNDGLVPSQLLTFPLIPRSSSNGRSKSGEQMSDSGNDSDPDEIYCAEDLASIYAERLSSSRDLVLNVIQRIQRLYSSEAEDGNSRNRGSSKMRIPESPSCQFTPNRNRSYLTSSMKVPSLDSSQQYPYSCYAPHKNVTNTLLSSSSAAQNTRSYFHYSTSKTLGRLSSVNNSGYTTNNNNNMNHITRTSRGMLGGSQNAVNRQLRPDKSVTTINCKTFNPVGSSSECVVAGSSNSSICTSCSREDEISFMYNANISSNTTAEFSSSNSLDSAAFLLPK